MITLEYADCYVMLVQLKSIKSLLLYISYRKGRVWPICWRRRTTIWCIPGFANYLSMTKVDIGGNKGLTFIVGKYYTRYALVSTDILKLHQSSQYLTLQHWLVSHSILTLYVVSCSYEIPDEHSCNNLPLV
jgi:hypothetical protein